MILKRVFWALVGIFLLILSQLLVPVVRDLFRGSFLFLVPFAVFFLLGAALIFLTYQKKVKGKLKKFLILTGASATGFFISVLLHNLVYGLLITIFGVDFWNKIGLGDEPLFFLLAIIVCPIGFLVGVVGSIILLPDRYNKKSNEKKI